MTKVTSAGGLAGIWAWARSRGGGQGRVSGLFRMPGLRVLRSHRAHASGRTTARMGMDPAPAIVTVRFGRGACTIAPSPMYIAT